MLEVLWALAGSTAFTTTGSGGALVFGTRSSPFSRRMGEAAFTPGTARMVLRVPAVSGMSPVRWNTVKWAVALNSVASISSRKPVMTARVTTMAKTPRAVPPRAKRTMMWTKAPFRWVFR
ncbi:hypothetical protein GALL_537780 [mine drainage metagenome]|uniref:Uncharacterized protein n=1 Tax=mine drainage metagenome TaxID=410659 RepID=A0A1J5PA27_9ZZZZ